MLEVWSLSQEQWGAIKILDKGFRVVNEAEVDVFLEFSCLSYDPVDVGSWISD